MAGFAIFSILGFMAYEQNVPISEVAESGEWDTYLHEGPGIHLKMNILDLLIN